LPIERECVKDYKLPGADFVVKKGTVVQVITELLKASIHFICSDSHLPGLYFASMSQVYPWDRGTNFAVKLGREVAKLMQKQPNEAES